jgi:proline iminopeptidase
METFYKQKYLKYKNKYLQSSPVAHAYPSVKPFNTGFLDVGNNHTIYFEECGNPNGIPFVYLHGGPGGGIGNDSKYTQLFDTKKTRIIAFDQRGCGKSKPFASLENNTTWDIVNDIEKLREHLKINKWFVTGGSWGSTLALIYSIKHTDRVSGLIISGIAFLRKSEIDWLYKKGGASNLRPDTWDEFENLIPVNERDDLLKAYYKRFQSTDEKIKLEACKIWTKWEMSLCYFYGENEKKEKFYDDPQNFVPVARIECHYFYNNTFYPNNNDNFILDNIEKIKHIPMIIVQGKYDLVCPIDSAYRLHKALPNSDLRVITLGGHSGYENAMLMAKINAIEDLLDLSSTI